MINQLVTAKWYANKATKAAAAGDMEKARDYWQTAMERFGEFHQFKQPEIEDVI